MKNGQYNRVREDILKRRTPKVKTRDREQGTSLGVVEGVNICLTQQNTLYVVFKDVVRWPYLRGGGVFFHDEANGTQTQDLPKEAFLKIRSILLKQQEIRKKHELDFDEDEAAFTFWNVV